MKRNIILSTLIAVLLISSAVLALDENSLLTLFLDGPHVKAMQEYYLDACPDITLLLTEPTAPKAGEAVKVRARINTHPDMTPYVTEKAEMIYTVDGKKFELLPMAKSDDDFWEATIPGQGAGTYVRYYIRAWDGGGNAVVQLPHRPDIDMTDSSYYITAVTDPDEEGPSDTSDFLSLGFATDGYYLYFRIETQGNVTPQMAGGDMYIKGLATHAADIRYWDTYSGMSFGLGEPAIIYAPNPFKPFKGLYKMDAILGDGKPLAEVKFTDKGNVLFGKVPIEALTHIPVQGYFIFAISAMINMAEENIALEDGTSHSILYFDGQGYVVK